MNVNQCYTETKTETEGHRTGDQNLETGIIVVIDHVPERIEEKDPDHAIETETGEDPGLGVLVEEVGEVIVEVGVVIGIGITTGDEIGRRQPETTKNKLKKPAKWE